MGFFDKLFGKKDNDLGLNDLDKGLSMNTGLPTGPDPSQGFSMPSQPQGMGGYQPNPSPFDSSNMGGGAIQDQQNFAISKEMEIISAKLDAIKVAIESLSQRLANIERIAYQNQEQPAYSYPQRRYYQESPPRTF